jgi:hypothetical protein
MSEEKDERKWVRGEGRSSREGRRRGGAVERV